MALSLGIEALTEKRDNLVAERDSAIDSFNSQISELESCIALLSGSNVWDIAQTEQKFDDENPNYIKSSTEEI